MEVGYNRQYVGARYVPQFFANANGSWDWAQGFQYEPLTIVRYGENTYTSKKLVPDTVGSPNLNPEYWANTGNYNGAIREIQQDIHFLQQRLINYDEKNIIMISDSYGMVNPSGYNWIDYLPGLIHANESYGYGLNGGSFSNKNSEFTFLGALKTHIEPQVKNPEKITHIIVGGGFNDASLIVSKESTIVSIVDAMREFYIYVHQKFPNAKLFLAFLAWETEVIRINRSNGNALYETYSAYLYGFGNKAYFLDGVQYSLHIAAYLDESGFHPNVSGSQYIAQNIATALMEGSVRVEINTKLAISSNFTTENLNLFYILTNGYAELYNKGTLTINSITLTEGRRTDILTFNADNVLLSNYSMCATVNCKYGNTYGTATLFIFGNIMYIIPQFTGVSLDLELYDIKFTWNPMIADRAEL